MWDKDNLKNHKGMSGLKHNPETLIKMRSSAIKRGNTGGWKKLVGKKRPEKVVEVMKKTMFKKGQTPWNKGRPHLKIRGTNHHHWKGGITDKNLKIRGSIEYKLWRKAVFERDNWTCIWCGERGGILNADHIKPFALFPELRFSIDNGRTLCKKCHLTTDTYGNASKK